ncbi:hypothetical protein BJ508DRAFT_302878 [Ascobolus immersus RN42]|uniref:Uncharacterized protein n=1 Tax=Ascobolus immersus RN42 TaxID=1160509 RepID=A0A3N4IHK4_ASCIM|nr:hypothetical protein BJ508DRAFT_302878 [Ascobolus immersus RN42]
MLAFSLFSTITFLLQIILAIAVPTPINSHIDGRGDLHLSEVTHTTSTTNPAGPGVECLSYILASSVNPEHSQRSSDCTSKTLEPYQSLSQGDAGIITCTTNDYSPLASDIINAVIRLTDISRDNMSCGDFSPPGQSCTAVELWNTAAVGYCRANWEAREGVGCVMLGWFVWELVRLCAVLDGVGESRAAGWLASGLAAITGRICLDVAISNMDNAIIWPSAFLGSFLRTSFRTHFMGCPQG